MIRPVLHVTAALSIPASELAFRFARSGGPGGQNVNKVSTKVELLFDVGGSQSLNERQRRLILERLAARIDSGGTLHVAVDTSRSQWTNRELALERFSDLLAEALRPVKKRVRSAPTHSSRERRIAEKKTHGRVKSMRGRVRPEE